MKNPSSSSVDASTICLRREIHKHPDLSGHEEATVQRVTEFFDPLGPDETVQNLGGNGVAFVFGGNGDGPTVLLRCELDALPIQESAQLPYASVKPGIGHLCGHDGHMAILATVGQSLSSRRPPRGRVILLYQPAEETGTGAAAVLSDPRFSDLAPDYAFALHNLPGYPLGQVIVRPGTLTCASRGMAIELVGSPAHAAQPETGNSPADAMCRLIDALSSLSVPSSTREIVFATVVGARLGREAYGSAPGDAEVWATLRSERDATMAAMVAKAERLVSDFAIANGLQFHIRYHDVFPATVNSILATEIVLRSVSDNSPMVPDSPFRWSEDFGYFTAACEGALFGLGAGVDTRDLHNSDYTFPEELVEIGAGIFEQIIANCLRAPRT